MKHTDTVILEKHKIIKITLLVSAFLSIIFLDQTGVAVILATIQKQLILSNTAIAWIMNSYMLALSVFLLLFARLSDSIGIKNVFCAGILLFMLASIGCALSNSAAWLIINRTLQGVGASMSYATYLLIFSHEIPKKDRGRVLGTAAAFAAIFLALGPLIGGFFSAIISWRYLFWLNVPICLVCFYFAASVCNRDDNVSKRLLADKLGLVMYLLAIVGIIFFFMEGSTLGWISPYIVIAIIGALIFFIMFIRYEKHQKEPLVDISLFKNKVFSTSIIILFGNYACVTSIAFWALWLEQTLGYSPLMAGIALLPAGVPYVLSSRIGGILYDRYGAKIPLLIGSTLFLVGLVEMAIVAPTLQYIWFMFGMVLVGLGWGFVRPCAILLGLNSVPAPQKSMATGIISTMRQLGAAVGFALVYAVISTYRHILLMDIIRQNKLNISTDRLSYLIAHLHKHPSLMHLVHTINMAYTQAFSLGLLVVSSLAMLNLILMIRCLDPAPVKEVAL